MPLFHPKVTAKSLKETSMPGRNILDEGSDVRNGTPVEQIKVISSPEPLEYLGFIRRFEEPLAMLERNDPIYIPMKNKKRSAEFADAA